MCGKIYVIGVRDSESILSFMQSSKYVTVSIKSGRGDILDCNMRSMTNSKKVYMLVVNPKVLTEQDKNDILQSSANKVQAQQVLSGSRPAAVELKNQVYTSAESWLFYVSKRYSQLNAIHLIGYTNAKGEGMSGLEKVFDDVLKENASDYMVVFEADAVRRAIPGTIPTVKADNSNKNNVVTTIDIDIQKICDTAAQTYLQRGAILVSEIKTGEIKAMSSTPVYDVTNINASIEKNDGSLINKAYAAYNCGSIFKLVVACAAIESGIFDFEYECTGSVDIAEHTISCYNSKAHKKLNMEQALEKSCNTYFITLAQKVGYEKVYSVAQRLGFGESIYIYDNIKSQSGNLCKKSTLASPAALANFAIGQGDTMVTPMQILKLVTTIANNGKYVPLNIIKEINYADGRSESYKKSQDEQLINEFVAKKLKVLMQGVCERGTAKKAMPEIGGAGAKTSTAQTGIVEDARKINRVWIAGYFPANEPKYAICVINEDGTSGEASAAPVFKYIADEINKLSFS